MLSRLADHYSAIELLGKGYQQRDSQLPHIGLIRAFKALFPDLRFQDLLRCTGILLKGSAVQCAGTTIAGWNAARSATVCDPGLEGRAG